VSRVPTRASSSICSSPVVRAERRSEP
jgi:hypothetical protein